MYHKTKCTISRLVLSLIIMLFLISACDKQDDGIMINTSEVSEISYTTATTGGNITSDGGANITARGVCWDINHNPTIAGNKTEDGSGTGTFTSILSGLIPETEYFVRAYATNNTGTEYGEQVSFTTSELGEDMVMDIDGNVYHTVVIGTQTWFKENLKATLFNNGDEIPLKSGADDWLNAVQAFCNYENKEENADIYGRIYNWYAIADQRKVCPSGWHVPTKDEWDVLVDYLGGSAVAGGKLKKIGTDLWLTPNEGATNESGFSAIPGGSRLMSGEFQYLGEVGVWWTSTGSINHDAWFLSVNNNTAKTISYLTLKKNGQAVRCIKDE